ncbi:hypothetical protein R75461_07766 [Paraburkholderia nemoris]|uniref:hypothetical protein n=1 Tax=Paraburkholderia nemoris TaxID=2793076 RepID=UPI00190A2CB9|nr:MULTISPECIES: hypothetical protein [Paraburkholderia]MBK3786535.1 hypothetical protein [Paraburkholderia aspalathi]CAE6856996.1 hypothetical protein R75461_07766 [Paraburkholderia nemoris]
MKTRYRCPDDALKAALAHAPLAGGASSLGALHGDASPGDALAPDEASAQAGFIRRRLEQLPPVQQALLVVTFAPRNLICGCHRPCCRGHYPNREWQRALETVVAHTAPLLSGHRPHIRLRTAIVGNLLTRTAETQLDLAQRCGVSRPTVATHTAILAAALMGTRQKGGAFDHALARIDTLLREAGIVGDPVADAVTDAAVRETQAA